MCISEKYTPLWIKGLVLPSRLINITVAIMFMLHFTAAGV